MNDIKIVEQNGVKYAEMYSPNVAEVMGLVPAGSSKPLRFPITGYVEDKDGNEIPMLGIKMMSDEKWKRITEEGAVKFFREQYGREPESLQEAFAAQRSFLEKLERGDASECNIY